MVIKTPDPALIIKDLPEKTTTITLNKKGIEAHTKKTDEGEKGQHSALTLPTEAGCKIIDLVPLKCKSQ